MKGVKAISPIHNIILVGRDASIAGFREYLAISIKTDAKFQLNNNENIKQQEPIRLNNTYFRSSEPHLPMLM